jgi:GAF domain-containing protein
MDDLERELALRLQAVAGKMACEQREEVLKALVTTLCKAFGLSPDEVAILLLSQDRQMLLFAYPPELARGGSNAFPVTFPSLAGRVAETGASLLINDVRDVQRLAFYERVPIMDTDPAGILKLLAVAVEGPDGRPQGVVEVSRRGDKLAEVGPDFQVDDQKLLERLAATAAPAIARAFGA